MAVDTDIFFGKDDVNKNLYRKKTYYTLVVEQEVIANNKDEADNKFTECGLDHSKINFDITDQKNGDVTIDTWVEEKEVMTEKEKDKNAGVVRDKDGNVMSEITNG